MKLEIAVRTPDEATASRNATVEKLLVRAGDVVKAGGKIALIRVD